MTRRAPAVGLRHALTPSTITAGFVAVLVGFSSSVAIVFQAALAFGADDAQLSSWIWALGIGMGVLSAGGSLLLRQPVMVAWSTPGAAVLASGGAGFTMAEAVGAFVVCGALITLVGATGIFSRVMDRIPAALAAALLAGVLARFAMVAFGAAETQPALIVIMLIVYLIGRRAVPRYAVLATLLAGMAYAQFAGDLAWSSVDAGWATPVFTRPDFALAPIVSLAIPLFIVTMASQNLPGVAAIRAAGYRMPISRIVAATGIGTILLGPFGGFTFNLSAITAAICLGPEAHPDPEKRYGAAVTNGVIYIAVGLLGAAVTGILLAFPAELVAAIAGLALLGTIGNGLSVAVAEERYREPAVITFLVTASGVTLADIGSAFWGIAAGVVALGLSTVGRSILRR